MPKINVYLPDDLAAAVRDAGIPVSAVCQRALADAVVAADGRTSATGDEPPKPGWSPSRFTDRARKVVEIAAESVGGDQEKVKSAHLLGALIAQGNNLAIMVLSSLDIETDDVLTELKATVTSARQQGAPHSATILEIGERAAQASLDLGHNFVGCEHLLLGILAGPDDDPAVVTLKTMGLTDERVRDAVRAALGGYTYAQGNLTLAGLSAPVRSILEEIRQRLSKIETGI